MKFIHIYHRALDMWIAVPSRYEELVRQYCVVEGWGSAHSNYADYNEDDSFLRLPDSFVVTRF